MAFYNFQKFKQRIYEPVKEGITGSNKGLSLVRRLAIIWPNVGLLVTGQLLQASIINESKYNNFYRRW